MFIELLKNLFQKILTERRKTKLTIKSLRLNHCFALIFMLYFSLIMSHYLLKLWPHNNWYTAKSILKNKLCKNCASFIFDFIGFVWVVYASMFSTVSFTLCPCVICKFVDVSPIDNKSIETEKRERKFLFFLPHDDMAFPNFPHVKIVIIIYLCFKELFWILDNLKTIQVNKL